MSGEIKPSLIQKLAREIPSLEISLWIETEMNKSGLFIKLKCKACTKFKKEISGMKMFKTTWIDGHTGAKLCGLKEQMSRLMRKTNIAYFIAKNDMAFHRFDQSCS